MASENKQNSPDQAALPAEEEEDDEEEEEEEDKEEDDDEEEEEEEEEEEDSEIDEEAQIAVEELRKRCSAALNSSFSQNRLAKKAVQAYDTVSKAIDNNRSHSDSHSET